MYPEPEACLNLPAWQEFYGFNLNGQNAWFDIDFDEEKRTVAFRTAECAPFGLPAQLRRLQLIRDPMAVKAVPAAEGVLCDLIWEERAAEQVMP